MVDRPWQTVFKMPIYDSVYAESLIVRAHTSNTNIANTDVNWRSLTSGGRWPLFWCARSPPEWRGCSRRWWCPPACPGRAPRPAHHNYNSSRDWQQLLCRLCIINTSLLAALSRLVQQISSSSYSIEAPGSCLLPRRLLFIGFTLIDIYFNINSIQQQNLQFS